MDPQKLFHRFVIESKGSYCLGQNSLFLGILRGLGYRWAFYVALVVRTICHYRLLRAYHVAGRANNDRVLIPAELGSLTHLLILVQPHPDSNVTYLVDVGSNLTHPVLLSDSEKNIVVGTTRTEKFRLRRRTDPRSSLGKVLGQHHSSSLPRL